MLIAILASYRKDETIPIAMHSLLACLSRHGIGSKPLQYMEC
jgi:hypothetical protein